MELKQKLEIAENCILWKLYLEAFFKSQKRLLHAGYSLIKFVESKARLFACVFIFPVLPSYF